MDSYLSKAIDGDREALNYLLDQHKDLAFSIALKLVGNETDAEDIVQEAFIKVLTSIGRFREESKFSTWLYRIVYNESLRRLNEKSRESLHLDRDNGVPLKFVPLDEDAFEKISREEEQKLVNEAMEKLNPNEHLVLSLFYSGEKSINEIIGITGFTKSNVRVLMHRGRKHLYDIINQYKHA
ncbi:MAG: sigma-70 family RNA polymerase sigma factor [Bacteroidales bacterium]|nr:sigma-70 family RNA polymerase sigma factor [Bacteroidales bacterium]